jgi:hypothetical protein
LLWEDLGLPSRQLRCHELDSQFQAPERDFGEPVCVVSKRQSPTQMVRERDNGGEERDTQARGGAQPSVGRWTGVRRGVDRAKVLARRVYPRYGQEMTIPTTSVAG